MSGIIRKKQSGEAWETVADTDGGGGSVAVNWVKLALAQRTLTVASSSTSWNGSSGMTIEAQAGSDFSLGGDGKLYTAGGGRFQCGGYMSYDTPTIDGGSTAQRFLWYGCSLGDLSVPLVASAGLDINVPVFDPAALNAGFGVQCGASVIGYSDPGGVVLAAVNVRLIQAAGTDSVPTYTDPFLVWQV